MMKAHHAGLRGLWLAAALLWVAACTVNPVTGKREFTFMSVGDEMAVGRQHYAPMQQMEGGRFILDPQLSAYVNEVGQRLAAVSDQPLNYEFVVLNNSVPNAWALPGGKIAINRGLLYEFSSEAELAAVLAHEVVHSAARHGARAQTRQIWTGLALALGGRFAEGRKHGGNLIGIAKVGAELISSSYSRKQERESDHYGIHYMVRAGYEPQAAVLLQETFLRLERGRREDWLAGLFASHPPSAERVENNKLLVAELAPTLAGKDLEVGVARYQEATAWLMRAKPAYDAFDAAEVAFHQDNTALARRKLDEALAALPDEARFHGLKGDLLAYDGHYRQALSSYGQALRLDSGYYEYYLGRGLARLDLERYADAYSDLQRSQDLLPTAVAANELGKLSLRAGDRQAAKQYFSEAADASGDLGEEAAAAFVRLDIVDNPATYLLAEYYQDEDGRLQVRITNDSPVTVNEAVIVVTNHQEAGTSRQQLTVPQLPPDHYMDLPTQWRQGTLAIQVSDVRL